MTLGKKQIKEHSRKVEVEIKYRIGCGGEVINWKPLY